MSNSPLLVGNCRWFVEFLRTFDRARLFWAGVPAHANFSHFQTRWCQDSADVKSCDRGDDDNGWMYLCKVEISQGQWLYSQLTPMYLLKQKCHIGQWLYSHLSPKIWRRCETFLTDQFWLGSITDKFQINIRQISDKYQGPNSDEVCVRPSNRWIIVARLQPAARVAPHASPTLGPTREVY